MNLGDTAEIGDPDGYQFLDWIKCSIFLEGMHNLVPKNLVGILAPSSAKWFAVIKYSGDGYVKDTDASHLDAAVCLKRDATMITFRFRGMERNPS